MPEQKCTIIAVCGSPGSGKSTFTLALGEAITKKKKKVICISPDTVCPALAFWLPSMVPTPDMSQSLGALMQYSNIDLQAIANSIVTHPSYSNLALMGLEYESYPGKYDMTDQSAATVIIEMLRHEVDYIIVDCVTDLKNDVFSYTAFSSADAVCCLITPNGKGLSWYAMAQTQGLDMINTIKFLTPVFPGSPLEEMRERVGKDAEDLPWSLEVEMHMIDGRGIGKFKKEAGRLYEGKLRSLADHIIETFS